MDANTAPFPSPPLLNLSISNMLSIFCWFFLCVCVSLIPRTPHTLFFLFWLFTFPPVYPPLPEVNVSSDCVLLKVLGAGVRETSPSFSFSTVRRWLNKSEQWVTCLHTWLSAQKTTRTHSVLPGHDWIIIAPDLITYLKALYFYSVLPQCLSFSFSGLPPPANSEVLAMLWIVAFFSQRQWWVCCGWGSLCMHSAGQTVQGVLQA